MKNIEIKVNKMVCNGCENRVCNALKTLEGILDVSASHETGVVKIQVKEGIDTNLLIEKIEDLGFEVIKED